MFMKNKTVKTPVKKTTVKKKTKKPESNMDIRKFTKKKKTPAKKKPMNPETKRRISQGVKAYHTCAKKVGKCQGLGEGVKGYYKCAKKSNCDGKTRRKLEGIGEKIKKRELDRNVVTITNFFDTAKDTIFRLELLKTIIYDYNFHKESFDKPRIRKKTKDSWKEKMDQEEQKFKRIANLPWFKKNYPNIKINDTGLRNKLNTSIKKLEGFLKEQEDRTVNRNIRTSRINDAVKKATKKK